jgi:glycosyltransferase involved in cell wall biosynthesis
MASPLILSVVLPTYMRAEVLRTTLQHLVDQTLDPQSYEVVVVDDGSADNTEEIVRQFINEASRHIIYLRHENRGPGYTQNRGILQASAPLVLLMADDIFLAQGALQAHAAAHEKHTESCVAILGHVIQSPELQQTTFQQKWDPFELRRLPQGQELPYWMFWACNISLKRDFMREYGMFREARGNAGPAAHEDVEVGHRLSQHGLRIFHEKSALGYHHHQESLETAISRSYQRGLNWEEVFQRMPHVELLIRQRLYSIGTLIAQRKELTEERSSYLLGADRNMFRLAVEAILRSILFNKFTVPFFWIPLMHLAEHSQFLAALMLPRFYRGVIVYHFRKGWRDQRQNSKIASKNAAIESR